MNGKVELPRLPRGRFFFWKNPEGKNDIVLFLCEAQPAVEKGYEYANLVMDVAQALKIKRVVTFASMPMPIDHNQESRVWGTVTEKKFVKDLKRMNIKPMRVGQISGLNGLLLSVAKERKIDGFCFLAEIPLYAIQIENPKASKAVLAALSDLIGLNLNLKGLDERARMVEDEIEKLVEYFKSGSMPGPISDEEAEQIRMSLAAITRLPDSARVRIEELFRAAERDISQAGELKNELDRWQIYKDYEDRFLDLFRPGRKNN